MRLHGYFRSAAAWRVRIALGLKGVAVDTVPIHLRRGEQRGPSYLALNPQGLVPTLETPDGVLTQSIAIVEWLEETFPNPALLPDTPHGRARVRAAALALAADTHPLQNLMVLGRLRALGLSEEAVQGWAAQVNAHGLEAFERLLPPDEAACCFGPAPGMADLCMVPQLGNARRFGVDVSRFPRLLRHEAACMALPAFVAAAPSQQADAEP